MKIKTKSSGVPTMKPKRNTAVVAGSAILILLLLVAIFYGLSNVMATETYYTLNSDVAPKTQVTEDLLEKVTTSKDGAPQNAISIEEVRQGTVYTKYPLKAGDILTPSNTGITLETGSGIPDGWSVTSFNVNADDAVAGNISRGDYFDIIGVDEEGSKYLFFNVLALQLNYATNNAVNENGKVVELGEQLQYVVGMPADDIAKLHHALAKFEKVKLVLSPSSLAYKERDVDGLSGTYTYSDSEPSDLYEGTDNAFTPILKDSKGVPVNIENCESGIVKDKSLCKQVMKAKKAKQSKSTNKSGSYDSSSSYETKETKTTDEYESSQSEKTSDKE